MYRYSYKCVSVYLCLSVTSNSSFHWCSIWKFSAAVASFWGVKYDRGLGWKLHKVCLLHSFSLIIENLSKREYIKKHDGDHPGDGEMIMISLAELKPQSYQFFQHCPLKATPQSVILSEWKGCCKGVVWKCVCVCVWVREREREREIKRGERSQQWKKWQITEYSQVQMDYQLRGCQSNWIRLDSMGI